MTTCLNVIITKFHTQLLYIVHTLGLRFFFPPSLLRAATAFPKSETSSAALVSAVAAFLPLPFPPAAAVKTLNTDGSLRFYAQNQLTFLARWFPPLASVNNI